MDSFGATLKKEREERGLTLDTVAAVIGIDRGSLSALERNEFDGLPDHEVMLAGLRSYADCLQVDAELMIEHYEKERERCLQRLADFVAERAAEVAARTEEASQAEEAPETHAAPDVVETPPSSVRPRRRPPLALIAPVVVVAALAAWWLLRPGGNVDTSPTVAEEVAPRIADPPAPLPPTVSEPAPSQSPRVAVEKPAPVAAGSGPVVTEHGVGTGVRNRELVGRRDRFAAGTQVWFWTRVEGGRRGDAIAHVWLHEGVEAARIPLSIGGRRWRTHSAKTLRSPGSWTVEARDASGAVLARSEFVCVR